MALPKGVGVGAKPTLGGVHDTTYICVIPQPLFLNGQNQIKLSDEKKEKMQRQFFPC